MNKGKLLGAFTAVSILSLNPVWSVRAAEHAHGDQAHAAAWSAIKEAVAVLHPTAGSHARGQVRFLQEGESVRVVAEVQGLQPGQKHAIHIHEFGDCSAPDGTSAGGHYNPEHNPHALPNVEERHAGDLGNLRADDEGKAHYEITVDNISIAGTKNPIIGRGVIVHAKADEGTQPTGNAGGRIACGVIGIAKPAK